MVPTKENPCKNLQARVSGIAGEFMRDAREMPDYGALKTLIAPLPELTQQRILDSFEAFVRVWKSIAVTGNRCGNTSIYRRFLRLKIVCDRAELAAYREWDASHQS
jgi:hypothetical protein